MLESTAISPLYTDYYQLTMAKGYFKGGHHEDPACFDYFFRKIPFSGGYVVFAGLGELIQLLEGLRFSEEDLSYLRSIGFEEDFLDYLGGFRFRGSIYGMQEGEVVFPYEPILRVEGTLLETQLVETLVLNCLNFQSLIATKASRMRRSAGDRVLSDFGLRRAQSFGAMGASRAALIGGFNATSNVLAAKLYGVPPVGTMAHSYVESFPDELEAFRAYARIFPDQCTLLVDTYNTLKSGVPHAIQVAREMEQAGHRLKGIRLDSGDLAYLAKKARTMLDGAGLDYVKIVVSNQLDEFVIKSLLDQEAPIDIFGVGTNLVIGKPDGALDGVYKLASAGNRPRLKISENLKKITLPGEKRVLRYLDAEGRFYADCIVLRDESGSRRMVHPFEREKSLDLSGLSFEEVFHCHMSDGKAVHGPIPLDKLRERVQERIRQLPEEHKRFHYPHIYKVGVSENLSKLRDELYKSYLNFI
jgi:nicotinate phosphoribosyltransferase